MKELEVDLPREGRISLGSFSFARAGAGADVLIAWDQAPDPWL